MKHNRILFLVVVSIIAPLLSFAVSYYYVNNKPYHDPPNAWKCKWIEPVDSADKRACASIPDAWAGDQMARCMVKLGYGRECPDEVRP
jgi:hypothetical protein